MKLLYPLLGLMLILASAVQAALITTIQLQSRPAEEIIPIVKPMLATGEVITGSGYKLFLRASPETQAMVMEIIDALDIAVNMLQISVFQGSEEELDTVNISGNLQIESGNSSIGAGSSEAGAGNISYNSGNVSGEVNSTSTQTHRTNSPVHQLRVSEGTEAFIQTVQQVAYYSGNNGTEFKNVTTGFYVLPPMVGVSPSGSDLSRIHRAKNAATISKPSVPTPRLPAAWVSGCRSAVSMNNSTARKAASAATAHPGAVARTVSGSGQIWLNRPQSNPRNTVKLKNHRL